MTGPDIDGRLGIEEWSKEGQTGDVVVVAMGEKQMQLLALYALGVELPVFVGDLIAGGTQAEPERGRGPLDGTRPAKISRRSRVEERCSR